MIGVREFFFYSFASSGVSFARHGCHRVAVVLSVYSSRPKAVWVFWSCE